LLLNRARGSCTLTLRSLYPGITTYAVYAWTLRFTENYKKFPLSVHALNRLLADEKYLCFVCMQHHANEG
jgi:hypothetical protein